MKSGKKFSVVSFGVTLLGVIKQVEPWGMFLVNKFGSIVFPGDKLFDV